VPSAQIGSESFAIRPPSTAVDVGRVAGPAAGPGLVVGVGGPAGVPADDDAAPAAGDLGRLVAVGVEGVVGCRVPQLAAAASPPAAAISSVRRLRSWLVR